MPRALIRVNNFLQNKSKNEANIDTISKIFFICELPLGINRLPLLRNVNTVFVVMSAVYSLAIVCLSIYSLNSIESCRYLYSSAVITSAILVIFCVFYNWISRDRLRRYYNELDDFDNQVGCTPKVGNNSISNLVQMVLTIPFLAVIVCIRLIMLRVNTFNPRLMPMVFVHVIEVHYAGHLLSLVVSRLRLINYYMRLSICSDGINIICSRDNSHSLYRLEKFMNLYHTIVKAYGYLIEAIKWQLLIMLIVSFIHILVDWYHVAHRIIRGDGDVITLLMFLGKSIGILLPLFAPCALGDQVQNEVKRLRELLTARLYENRIDKRSRGVARALLAWTETRDLSFSLLRMLDVDISLPFKFVGLLVTYLIILLQFEKVIST